MVPITRSAWLRARAALAALVTLGVWIDGGASRLPLTPADAVQTARLLREAGTPHNPQGAVSISPDQTWYAARVVRGDLVRNGAWVDIIAGRLDSLEEATSYRLVARLFTSGLGFGPGYVGPFLDTYDGALNPIRWLGHHHIAFLWSDSRNIRQVVRVDLYNSSAEYITHHPTHVIAFDINSSGTVLYKALAPRKSNAASTSRDGFVVPDDIDALALYMHDSSGSAFAQLTATEWFVKRPGHDVRQISVGGRDVSHYTQYTVNFSPDGRLALVNEYPSVVPDAWNSYTDQRMKDYLAAARRDKRDFFGKHAQQLFVVDIENESARPLWSAATRFTLSETAWSPDSRFVLVAPTFSVPTDTYAAGLAGQAAVVVEISTGEYQYLPVRVAWYDVQQGAWRGDREVSLVVRAGAALEERVFRRSSAGWQEIEQEAIPAPGPRIRMEIHEDLNVPPRLVAVDSRTGEERVVLDPNAQIMERFTLGHVERIEGTLATGNTWEARLFYPVNYDRGRRYPLVIQSTYGEQISSRFTLYGEELAPLGPTLIAPYAGQLLANRGMFVLHLNVRMGQEWGTPKESELRREAFEAAAEHLIGTGRAEKGRIGLIGFSRNGHWVQYTLTHSSFPFAAAIAADNWDSSYFQQTLLGYGGANFAAKINGGMPFGEGLEAWLENAPGFNVEKIHTPLRLVSQSAGLFGVLTGWEVFSRLKFLAKPVEYYVMPDAEEHGAHNTQNPAQIVAVQQGTVDWFNFWLNNYEDPDPSKAKLYAGWRALRELQQRNSAVMPGQ